MTIGLSITRFEQLFSKQINRKYCSTTSSCTGAMHIALLALGIKGDEVIVPDITWVATASVVEAVGAIPYLLTLISTIGL